MTKKVPQITAFLFSVILLIISCLTVNALENNSTSNHLNSEEKTYEEAKALLRQSKSDKALELLFSLKDSVPSGHELKNKINISIAEGYRLRQEFQKGLSLLYELITKPDLPKIDKANAYNRIAALYNEGPSFPSKYDSVIKYSNQCIEIAQINGFTAELATSQNELGYIYRMKSIQDLPKALKLLTAAHENFLSIGDKQNAVAVSINLARTYTIMNDYERAQEVLDSAMTYFNESEDRYLYNRICFFKAGIYRRQNNYKQAYDYMFKSRQLTNAYYKDQLKQKIFEMAAKYEAEKKERENRELRRNNEIQALNLKYKNNAILFLSIGILLAGILIVIILWLLRKRSVANKLLVAKNLELAKLDSQLDEPEKYFKTIQKKELFSASSPNNKRDEEIIEKFKKHFAEEKPYLYSNVSIEEVATEIGTNRSYLSKAINDSFNKSFNNIVNEFRIHAARQIIADKKYEQFSLEAIAEMVGYNSRTTFIRNFKKITGLTPSYFRKSIEEEQRQ